jgi:hypothetical protein
MLRSRRRRSPPRRRAASASLLLSGLCQKQKARLRNAAARHVEPSASRNVHWQARERLPLLVFARLLVTPYHDHDAAHTPRRGHGDGGRQPSTRSAVRPVRPCQRSIVTWTYFGSISIP